MLKKLMIVLAAIAILFTLYLVYLGQVSRTGTAPGLDDGRLAACPDKPNCVCSEYPRAREHFIDPIAIGSTPMAQAMASLTRIVRESGGNIEIDRADYIAATFASSLFGFVDDVEFRADAEASVIHLRSASRVGTSDLGANRKRVESIRQRLLASDASQSTS